SQANKGCTVSRSFPLSRLRERTGVRAGFQAAWGHSLDRQALVACEDPFNAKDAKNTKSSKVLSSFATFATFAIFAFPFLRRRRPSPQPSPASGRGSAAGCVSSAVGGTQAPWATRMSYILDALRRADAERERGAVP